MLLVLTTSMNPALWCVWVGGGGEGGGGGGGGQARGEGGGSCAP